MEARFDCAQARTSAPRLAIVSRQTDYDANVTRSAMQACAAICEACGDECERHGGTGMEHCRVCAEACRRCEDACNQLLAAIGG